jgi:hypothetical protein
MICDEQDVNYSVNAIKGSPCEESLMEKSEPRDVPPSMAKWRAHANELLDITKEFVGCQIVAPDTPHHKEVAKIIAFKFIQAVRTFKSVLILTDSGNGTDSLILSRALFESLVDIAYLIENPKDVWRYLEESASLESKLRHAQKFYGPPSGDAGIQRRPSSDELLKQFSKLAEEHSSCKSWQRLSLRNRAEKTGYPDIVELYEMVYPTTSAYVHGASGIVLDYMRGMSSSSTRFHVSYDRVDTELELAVGLSAEIFLRLVAFLDALFDWGLRARVEQLAGVQQP